MRGGLWAREVNVKNWKFSLVLIFFAIMASNFCTPADLVSKGASAARVHFGVIMQYYIYGKGVNGEGIASFLELYFPNESYAFIDDGEEASSLATLYKQIKKEDRILIASTLHYEKIVQNLKQYDLSNYENGIVWCGEIINNQLKEYKRQHSFKKYVGLARYTENFFLDMESRLKAVGYGVICFIDSQELYKKYNANSFCFFTPHAILEQIEEVDMFLIADIVPTNQKVITVDITHGFQGSLVYPFMKFSSTDEGFLKYAYSTADYVVCGSKKIHRAYEEFFQNIQKKPILLDTGYLKLDKDVQEYEKFCKQQQAAGIKPQNNIVIFAFTLFDDIARIVALIKECFKLNLRAFFKPHPFYAGKLMSEISEIFASENRFVKNTESKEELFYHSLCLVTECSSMGYTYPLTTAKPSICLDMHSEGLGNRRESYYEEKLMYLCQSDAGLCQSLQNILQEEKSYPLKVEQYRENECFGFRNAIQNLMQQIQSILRD